VWHLLEVEGLELRRETPLHREGVDHVLEHVAAAEAAPDLEVEVIGAVVPHRHGGHDVGGLDPRAERVPSGCWITRTPP
jgi:hypothetical protein